MKTFWISCVAAVLLSVCHTMAIDDMDTVNQHFEAQRIEIQATVDKNNAKQINCLARNIYYEARGETKAGQEAIALVTINRVKAHFAPTICDVVYQRGQFEWTHMKSTKLDILRWREANEVAQLAYLGNIRDLTQGATYFHNTQVDPTSWLINKVPTVKIGNHIFFRKRHTNDPVATNP